MELNVYQKKIKKFDLFEASGTLDMAFLDKVLGLAGESGEVADKVKKLIRDKNGVLSATDKEALAKELGDIFWYLATLARYLDFSLEEIAQLTIDKLEGRTVRGTIHGNGDDR